MIYKFREQNQNLFIFVSDIIYFSKNSILYDLLILHSLIMKKLYYFDEILKNLDTILHK